mmetsp:Transcript_23768/g.35693  ORF Transcript_23768/g.35693 Transcript_23768/m.35693 type:complete len:96 (-) Transcript_23768:1271-1558(-)
MAGVNPPIIANAALYPTLTEVSRISGGKFSTIQALLGAPNNESPAPSNSCEKNATAALPTEINPIAIGPANIMRTPPTTITRILPTWSDNHPADG